MSFRGKKQKRKMCEGCSHWVKTIKFHIETGRVETSPEYCDSEESCSSSCASYYPKLSKLEKLKKQKEIERYFSRDIKKGYMVAMTKEEPSKLHSKR